MTKKTKIGLGLGFAALLAFWYYKTQQNKPAVGATSNCCG